MLIRFSVRNYKSFVEPAEISMQRPSLASAVPKHGESWADVTWRVCSIFGANASGKTTILTALGDLSAAVADKNFRLHNPNLLLPGLANAPTVYEVEFVVDQVRYKYIVQAEAALIRYEALYSYPAPSEDVKRFVKRLMFERTYVEGEDRPRIKAGSTLRGATAEVGRLTKKNYLFLSVAREYEHDTLEPIARGIAMGPGLLPVMHSEAVRDSNLQWIMRQIAEEKSSWKKISNALLKVADFGVERIEVDERELSDEQLQRLRDIFREDGEEVDAEVPEELIRMVSRSLTFYHSSVGGEAVPLSLSSQSDGTKVWLALAGRAVESIQNGKILLVDELDSSLHPRLVRTLIEIFKDPQVNSLGAQLIFNTHDSNLLSNSPTRLLESEEILIAKKNRFGSSQLEGIKKSYVQGQSNFEKQYLAGRFDGVPDIHLSTLYACLTGENE